MSEETWGTRLNHAKRLLNKLKQREAVMFCLFLLLLFFFKRTERQMVVQRPDRSSKCHAYQFRSNGHVSGRRQERGSCYAGFKTFLRINAAIYQGFWSPE